MRERCSVCEKPLDDGREVVAWDYRTIHADCDYPAARQAGEHFGARYGDYIARHTAEMVEAGFGHVAGQSLGERLAGNDGA